MSKNTGLVFDIKRFAVHDGPGIRTTVFLKGCPLSCWWCHNPEGLSRKQEIIYYEYKCMNCGNCIEICSENAIKNNRVRNYHLCKSCGECVEACPTSSQQLIGQIYTAEKLVKELEKDEIYFDSSSGGVTFSGGEPLMQDDFLKETLKLCKKNQFHTTIDTSGYASEDLFKSIAKDVDLILFDLKILDDKQHKKYTGVSNKIILKNLETLLKLKKNVILRFALIPKITTSKENLKNMLNYIETLNGINKIDLLTFHNVNEKYIRLGKEYKMNNAISLKTEEIKYIKEKFEQRGFNVKIGG